jgi:hypothetical protein
MGWSARIAETEHGRRIERRPPDRQAEAGWTAAQRYWQQTERLSVREQRSVREQHTRERSRDGGYER